MDYGSFLAGAWGWRGVGAGLEWGEVSGMGLGYYSVGRCGMADRELKGRWDLRLDYRLSGRRRRCSFEEYREYKRIARSEGLRLLRRPGYVVGSLLSPALAIWLIHGAFASERFGWERIVTASVMLVAYWAGVESTKDHFVERVILLRECPEELWSIGRGDEVRQARDLRLWVSPVSAIMAGVGVAAGKERAWEGRLLAGAIAFALAFFLGYLLASPRVWSREGRFRAQGEEAPRE